MEAAAQATWRVRAKGATSPSKSRVPDQAAQALAWEKVAELAADTNVVDLVVVRAATLYQPVVVEQVVGLAVEWAPAVELVGEPVAALVDIPLEHSEAVVGVACTLVAVVEAVVVGPVVAYTPVEVEVVAMAVALAAALAVARAQAEAQEPNSLQSRPSPIGAHELAYLLRHKP